MVLFCFVFEKMSSSLAMLLVLLLVHVGKRSNSRLNVSSKGLHFFKGKTPTQAFSCEYCKIFKNSFFIGHLFIILFQNFLCDDRY